MASLFPDWPSTQGLVGIAKLAAQGPLLEAKRRTEYFELPTRKYITRCASDRVPFAFTINPYRGCEFGCKYCYARYTHEFMELRNPVDFEVRIFAKLWDASGFRAELAKVPRGEHIAVGTATDPYQPAERRFGITRKILEILAEDYGRRIWITTKSDLVARDTDLLAGIARRNLVSVNMTITTLDEKLARQVEPYAPRPLLRLAAIRILTQSGIPCGVLCCPIMPLINDSASSIDAVARAAAEAGATSFSGNVLFLKPCASKVFLPFLELEFPHLVRRYRERFGNTAFLRGEYPELIHRRLMAARERHRLGGRPVEYDPRELADDPQLPLFPSGS
jgi:DNA repair photolyase